MSNFVFRTVWWCHSFCVWRWYHSWARPTVSYYVSFSWRSERDNLWVSEKSVRWGFFSLLLARSLGLFTWIIGVGRNAWFSHQWCCWRWNISDSREVVGTTWLGKQACRWLATCWHSESIFSFSVGVIILSSTPAHLHGFVSVFLFLCLLTSIA